MSDAPGLEPEDRPAGPGGPPAGPPSWDGQPFRPPQGPGTFWPWFGPASTGARLVAWLMDVAAFLVLGLIPMAVAALTGGLAINPAAARQLEADPNALPTVPYVAVQSGPLGLAAALWVALALAYAAAGWAIAGRLPGQAVRSLWVVDAGTSRKLSAGRAFLRAVIVAGVPSFGFAVAGFALFQVAAVVPASQLQDRVRLGQPDVEGWVNLFYWSAMAGALWCAGLLVSVAAARDRRGIHDRLTGSVVIGRPAASGPASWWPATPVPPYATFGATPPGGAAAPAGQPDAPGGPPSVWTGLAGGPGAPGPQDGPAAAGAPPESGGAGGPEGTAAQPDAAAEGRTGPVGSRLPEGIRIAAFRRRMNAYSLDAFLLFLIYTAVELVVAPPTASGEVPAERLRMLAGFLGSVAQAAYFVGTWWALQGTVGQRLIGLRVVRETGDRRLGPIDALVRWAVLQGPLALLMAAPDILSYILVAVLLGWTIVLVRSVQEDPDARGYHDRLAGSVVVEPVYPGR